MLRVVFLLAGAQAFVPFASAPVRLATARRAATLSTDDFDPFEVLSLDAISLRECTPPERARAVRAAFRDAAKRCHPDTNVGTPCVDEFARVTRAADMLRSDEVLEEALAVQWREEVRNWSAEQVASHLRNAGHPDAVASAFMEYGVTGRHVVGKWTGADVRGDDVDNFIFSLRWLGVYRWLGTDDESEAQHTEETLSELVGFECGGNYFKSRARAQEQAINTPPPM